MTISSLEETKQDNSDPIIRRDMSIKMESISNILKSKERRNPEMSDLKSL